MRKKARQKKCSEIGKNEIERKRKRMEKETKKRKGPKQGKNGIERKKSRKK